MRRLRLTLCIPAVLCASCAAPVQGAEEACHVYFGHMDNYDLTLVLRGDPVASQARAKFHLVRSDTTHFCSIDGPVARVPNQPEVLRLTARGGCELELAFDQDSVTVSAAGEPNRCAAHCGAEVVIGTRRGAVSTGQASVRLCGSRR